MFGWTGSQAATTTSRSGIGATQTHFGQARESALLRDSCHSPFRRRRNIRIWPFFLAASVMPTYSQVNRSALCNANTRRHRFGDVHATLGSHGLDPSSAADMRSKEVISVQDWVVRRVDRTQVQADAKPHIGRKSVCLQFPCSSSRVRTGQKPLRTPPLPALLDFAGACGDDCVMPPIRSRARIAASMRH